MSTHIVRGGPHAVRIFPLSGVGAVAGPPGWHRGAGGPSFARDAVANAPPVRLSSRQRRTRGHRRDEAPPLRRLTPGPRSAFACSRIARSTWC
jgi:hypothetical protein